MNKLANFTPIAHSWLNRLAPLILLISIVWLCWNLSRIIWLMLSPAIAPNLPIVPAQVNNEAAYNQNSYMVFANPVVNSQPTQPNVAPANLKLKGVFPAVFMENSSALIEVSGRVKNYSVGQKIEGTQFKLSNVYWNEIIVIDEQGGESVVTLAEPFSLNQEFMVNGGQPNYNDGAPSDFSNQVQQQNQQQAPDNANANNPPIIGMIDHAIERIRDNPASYFSEIGVLATGDGYEVTDTLAGKLPTDTGIMPGDKLISLNNKNIGSDPMADAALLAQIKETRAAEITVQRGEAIFTFRQSF